MGLESLHEQKQVFPPFGGEGGGPIKLTLFWGGAEFPNEAFGQLSNC